jgi:predicted dehydrogenase
MHEIHLAVYHPEEAEVARIATRLRGATVEACADRVRFHCPPGKLATVMLVGFADWEYVDRLFGGVPVLLVADPCPPADVIETLFAAARASGVQLAVVNPDRYLPSRQLIRKQLGGPLGEAGLLRLHRWEPANGAAELDRLPEPLLRDLDLTLWLMNRQPDRVYAVEQNSDARTGRYLQVHLGFPHGGMALIDYTSRLPAGDGYQSLSVIASTGAAYADDHQNAQLLYRGERPRAVRTEERAGQLAAVAQEFVDALRDGRDLSASAEQWRDVFAVAGAVQHSLASGRAVVMGGR